MSSRRRLQNYIFKTFEVTIDTMSARGWGQGAFKNEDGRSIPVEVRGALPGDRLIAEGRKVDDSMLQAVIVQMLDSVYDRIPSSCPHSATRCDKNTGCGGCTLRECAYETQCRIKRDILIKFLKKNHIDAPVEAMLPCDIQTYYRNKMELSFGPDGEEQIGVGLHPSGFRFEVIDMNYCDMLSPLLSELAQKTSQWARLHHVSYFKFRENKGFLRLLTLREGKRTGKNMIILTTSGDEDVCFDDNETLSAQQVVARYVDDVLNHLSVPVDTFYWTVVSAQKGRQTTTIDHLIFGNPVLPEKMLMPDEEHALCYEILPHAFFQPNTIQAERLYRVVLDMAANYVNAQTPILDLYCGTGTIALTFARHGHRAVAVDIEKQAIENARKNAVQNGLEDRVVFYAGDSAEILKQLLDNKADFTDFFLVVDPPRRGLLPTAYRQIMRIRPRALVYVSCNPESLAEDLYKFQQDGYQILKIQPVDMLPQTAHVETVVLLSRD